MDIDDIKSTKLRLECISGNVDWLHPCVIKESLKNALKTIECLEAKIDTLENQVSELIS